MALFQIKIVKKLLRLICSFILIFSYLHLLLCRYPIFLGITADEDGNLQVTKELCYYTETCRTKHRLWLPYTCLHLAERSRPFYGVDKLSPQKPTKQSNTTPRKRKFKEDHTLPLCVKPSNRAPDLNITYDKTHTPLKQGRYENAFNEFVRQGKEMLFDHFYYLLKNNIEENEDILDYLMNVDASTEDKFEAVIKNIVTLKEVENYLHQCWRYNFVHKAEKDSNSNDTSPVKAAITLHISWCLVCGLDTNRLRECTNCPASYHLSCRREWLLTIIHRKNPPQKAPKQVTLVEKILSSTRTICSVKKNDNKENLDLCPSCMWGPKVGYDDVVWHKLGTCSWWPAKVLPPGAVPSCLLAKSHSAHQWPLRYYGAENYSWGDMSRMCLFLPSHTAALRGHNPLLQKGVLDACDDYIAVYLT
ncbi:uncharacterized protein LOC128679547 isoform X2 [Plodia interpunctella]|uniref:uncharacterized protein LOC128679547 isoform X2 n=1 Tax=Plodia interpunctella TaxID=58824 RepID=UPI0023678AC3|nr:uncharacterized protein LOC128679547 isoform X2 [Plodia interpunctella]